VLVEAVRTPDNDPGKRSITIAGDTAQRLVFDNNFSGWEQLLQYTGQPAIVRPLKLSYRSTAEVMLLAREILGPDLAPEEPLAARPGEPVELHEFGDLGEAIAFLGDALRNLMNREPTASCAVISRHPEQADAYFEGLRRAEVPALRRVRRDEFNFQPGVDVTDVAQVKGLEFDYVVMVDVNAASYPDQHWARHLLHIGVTRAAHQLWLVSTEPGDHDRQYGPADLAGNGPGELRGLGPLVHGRRRGGGADLDVRVQIVEALLRDRAGRGIDQALADAGDLAADLDVGAVAHRRRITVGGELDRGVRGDEPVGATAVDDHAEALRRALVLVPHLAGEPAADRADLDRHVAGERAGFVAFEAFAAGQGGCENLGVEQRIPDRRGCGFEPVFTLELHHEPPSCWIG